MYWVSDNISSLCSCIVLVMVNIDIMYLSFLKNFMYIVRGIISLICTPSQMLSTMLSATLLCACDRFWYTYIERWGVLLILVLLT